MRTERRFYVYMMTSSSRRALYIGITNNLVRRVWEHKTGSFAGFASQYRTTRLVYYEVFRDVRNAIDREKQLKRWRREKKMGLITQMNPQFRDLAADWFPPDSPQGPSTR